MSCRRRLRVEWLSTYAESGGVAAGGVSSYTARITSRLAAMVPRLTVLAPREEVAWCDPSFVKREWQRNNICSVIRVVLGTPAVLHVQHEVFMFGGAFSALLVPIVLRLRRLLGFTNVVTLHGVVSSARIDAGFCRRYRLSAVPPALLRLVFGWIFVNIIEGSDAVVVHEEEFKRIVVHEYNAVADKVHVIPHPLVSYDCPVDADSAKAQLGIPGRRVVLFFGFVAAYKGVEALLEAWERYIEKGNDDMLLVAGGPSPRSVDDDQYSAWYAGIKERAANSERVKWLGFVDDESVGVIFSAADIVVFPYRDLLSSSGPLSVAAYYGKRVLCSSHLAPVIEDDVPRCELDPGSFADAMEAALEGPVPESMQRWREERDVQYIAERYARLYEAVE